MAEEPILSRIQRLDNVLKQMEGTKACGGYENDNIQSPKSSTVSSTASSVAEQGWSSSLDNYSPRSLEKHCRPIEEVVTEAELKGTIIQRLVNVEDRLTELLMQLGETPKIIRPETALPPPGKAAISGEQGKAPAETRGGGFKKSLPKKGGFKSFVKSCMKTKGQGDHNISA